MQGRWRATATPDSVNAIDATRHQLDVVLSRYDNLLCPLGCCCKGMLSRGQISCNNKRHSHVNPMRQLYAGSSRGTTLAQPSRVTILSADLVLSAHVPNGHCLRGERCSRKWRVEKGFDEMKNVKKRKKQRQNENWSVTGQCEK